MIEVHFSNDLSNVADESDALIVSSYLFWRSVSIFDKAGNGSLNERRKWNTVEKFYCNTHKFVLRFPLNSVSIDFCLSDWSVSNGRRNTLDTSGIKNEVVRSEPLHFSQTLKGKPTASYKTNIITNTVSNSIVWMNFW